MKIAIVYDAIYPYVKGGAEKRLWELARRLSLRGHEVHLFGMRYWEGADHIEREGVHLHGVCRPPDLYTGGRRSIREAVWFSLCLVRPLLREKWDIIDCQQFPYLPCFSAKIVSLAKKTPLVITWIEVWGDYWYDYLGSPGWIGKLAEKCIARFQNPTIAISHFTAVRLAQMYTVPVPAVIPIGIDLSALQGISPAQDRTDIIFIGRLIREKNADLLVQATRIIMEKYPDIRVIIVGEGPEREKLRRHIDENGLETRIILHNFFTDHNDLIALLRASRVFVLPSTREGFGISALEALACGLPVVTVDHPANAVQDLVTAKTGFVSAVSAEDLATKICLALEQKDGMRISCIQAAEPFAWDRIVTDLENFYASVIKSGSR
jgi:glycosyltransferase involved in cell wall biosynthesis